MVLFESVQVFVQADRGEMLGVSDSFQEIGDLVDGDRHRPQVPDDETFGLVLCRVTTSRKVRAASA